MLWPCFRWQPFSSAWFITPLLFGFLSVCVSFPLLIWSFVWIGFLTTGFGQLCHCHLFTISYSFSPSFTLGEEQIRSDTGVGSHPNLWWSHSSHSISTATFINPLWHRLVITLHFLKLMHSSIAKSKWKVEGVTAVAKIVWFGWGTAELRVFRAYFSNL